MSIFEGLHIKLDLKRYPNSIFFFKGERLWMEYDRRYKKLWCRGEFLEVLERKNKLDYLEVQAFIKGQVEQHFKLKGITLTKIGGEQFQQEEQHFKQ